MKIFKAEPIDSQLNDPRWSASTHKGWVIIRAVDEGKACHIAASELGIAAEKKPGEEILTSPWRSIVRYAELTNEEIENSNYAIEGEEEIIDRE